MTIHQDAHLYLASLLPEQAVSHRIERGRAAWLQVLQGRVNSLGNDLSAGDSAALTDENTVAVQATGPSEVISAEITGRRGVGPRATDPRHRGLAPRHRPAPPDPRHPTSRHHGISRNSVSVLRPEMVRRAHCPVMVVKAPARAAGAPTPKIADQPRLEGQIMSESLPEVYLARRDGEGDLVAAHGPDRYPADRAGKPTIDSPMLGRGGR